MSAQLRAHYKTLLMRGMPLLELAFDGVPDRVLEDTLTMHAMRWAQRNRLVAIDLYQDGSGCFEVEDSGIGHASDFARKCCEPYRFAWDTEMRGMLAALVAATWHMEPKQ